MGSGDRGNCRRDSRREFLRRAAIGAGAITVLPSRIWAGPSPNGIVQLACIGIGARGGSIARWIGGKKEAEVVAVCDVDIGTKETKKVLETFPKARRFQDYREMFDTMGDSIDAVTIGTPDHSHFPICMHAMKRGKHVYVEKPLAHTFRECELLIEAEKKYGVVCQMGNQGHSGGNYFQFKAWTEAGVIRNVRRVDAHMNSKRRWHGWGATCTGYPSEPIPATLDWDTWLTTRPERPYSKRLHHGEWRSWFEFGNGAFGDWGPHILDTIHEFLELGLPERVTAVKREGSNEFVYPQASTISFRFPARGVHPPMEIVWYDGVHNHAPRPEELDEGRKLRECGKIIYSDEYTFLGGTHNATLRIIPEKNMRAVARTLPRYSSRNSDHALNFLRACQGNEKTRSPFAVSGPLTQVFMLGCIAQRLGGTLEFDRDAKRITNNPQAHDLLSGLPPRRGWESCYTL